MDRKKNVFVIFILLAIAIVAAGVCIGVLTSGVTGGARQASSNNASVVIDANDAVDRTADGPSPTPSPLEVVLGASTLPPTASPSPRPSLPPSPAPTSLPPSPVPSHTPSLTPTSLPSNSPSSAISTQPSTTSASSNCRHLDSAVCRITVFYAIADVPYTDVERAELPPQIASLPNNAEFLVHLGDIRSARENPVCQLQEYEEIAGMLKKSRVPVFIVVGGEFPPDYGMLNPSSCSLTHTLFPPIDNEFNDCSNVSTGWDYWMQELSNFENYWNHHFVVTRPPERPENFAFVHKRTLFIGLNLVGGRIHDADEWTSRLSEQANWTTMLMERHTSGLDESIEQVWSVVIFGHANPNAAHGLFFTPLTTYIQTALRPRKIPVLYMNGDAHVWSLDSSYMGVDELLRIQLTGGTSEPPLQVIVAPNAEAETASAESVFLYDRRL